MIIKEIKYSFFSLPLKLHFQNSFFSFYKKEGFIVEAADELNNKTLAEASPLPNYSAESLINVENELKKISSQQLFLDDDINSAVQKIKSFSLSNSTQFMLEQIFLNLFLIRNKNSVHKYFERQFKNKIDVNAVLDMSEKNKILKIIKRKLETNYHTFKIKVGRESFNEDINLINEIHSQFGNSIKIRLDANGKWNIKEAIKFLNQLKDFNIEYIEEPCNNLMSSLELSKQSQIPIALDESLRNFIDAKRIIEESNIKFVIMKPMVYGGIFDTLQLIKIAESKNKFIIISSAFESAIGKSSLTFLAALVAHNFAHGLDTSDYFQKNLCEDFYKVINGKISFDITNYPPQFRLNA